MGTVVVPFILGVVIVGGGAAIAMDEKKVRWLLISVLGTAFLVAATFYLAPQELSTGAPATSSIDAGEYGVAYVGPSWSGYVDVLTLKDGVLPMIYYRFPVEVFDGQVNTEATKLVVVESDGFKKLVLK